MCQTLVSKSKINKKENSRAPTGARLCSCLTGVKLVKNVD